MPSENMNKDTKFLACEDSFGKDANILAGSYKTVEEAKTAILKELEN